jgi:hypothetical protein
MLETMRRSSGVSGGVECWADSVQDRWSELKSKKQKEGKDLQLAEGRRPLSLSSCKELPEAGIAFTTLDSLPPI